MKHDLENLANHVDRVRSDLKTPWTPVSAEAARRRMRENRARREYYQRWNERMRVALQPLADAAGHWS